LFHYKYKINNTFDTRREITMEQRANIKFCEIEQNISNVTGDL